jgi:predicted  nucleic acid-binding Zn-ribbon protein
MKRLIILLLAVLTLTGCRVAKKSWVKENFTQNEQLTSTLKTQTDSVTKQIKQVTKQFESRLQELASNSSSNTTQTETENTTVTGTIEAETGTEKSVTIGGTTITSNGASISFVTNNTRSLSKQFEESITTITKQLTTERQYREDLQQEVTSLKIQNLNMQREITELKTERSKYVTKKGFTFGFWFWIIIAGLVVLAFFYFKKQIPFI